MLIQNRDGLKRIAEKLAGLSPLILRLITGVAGSLALCVVLGAAVMGPPSFASRFFGSWTSIGTILAFVSWSVLMLRATLDLFTRGAFRADLLILMFATILMIQLIDQLLAN